MSTPVKSSPQVQVPDIISQAVDIVSGVATGVKNTVRLLLGNPGSELQKITKLPMNVPNCECSTRLFSHKNFKNLKSFKLPKIKTLTFEAETIEVDVKKLKGSERPEQVKPQGEKIKTKIPLRGEYKYSEIRIMDSFAKELIKSPPELEQEKAKL